MYCNTDVCLVSLALWVNTKITSSTLYLPVYLFHIWQNDNRKKHLIVLYITKSITYLSKDLNFFTVFIVNFIYLSSVFNTQALAPLRK